MEQSIFAANPENAIRNEKEINKSDIRNSFQIDRDRILYSKAFRRLRGKTQVFVAGYDDHVRNRLSHTLEVAQIARTIANAVGLNETLTEAIALGHDLGHTPFGHVGERVLHEISCGASVLDEKKICHEKNNHGFKHNWQSVRVSVDLEFHNRKFAGLNLTKETLWGFLHHSSLGYSPKKIKPDLCEITYFENHYKKIFDNENNWTFEAEIVSLADEIAQRHHDIEDGLITGILEKNELIAKLKKYFDKVNNPFKNDFLSNLETAKQEKHPEFYFNDLSKSIVNFYVRTSVKAINELFKEISKKYNIADNKDFYSAKKIIYKDHIENDKDLEKRLLSKDLFEADSNLQKDFFRKRILLSYQAQKTDGKAAYIIKKIVEAYLTNPQQLPDNAILMLFIDYEKSKKSKKDIIDKVLNKTKTKPEIIGKLRIDLDDKFKEGNCELRASLVRTIIDYVAGMTDDYAIAQYEQLYGAKKQSRY